MGKNVAIIDYGMGNLRSVEKAWSVVGANSRIIASPKEISADDILVFPGQGCILDAMKLLKSTGFDSAIKDWIASDKPFFGICLGLQALFEYSEEDIDADLDNKIDNLITNLFNNTKAFAESKNTEIEQEVGLIEVDTENNFVVSTRALGKFYMLKKKIKLAISKLFVAIPKIILKAVDTEGN